MAGGVDRGGRKRNTYTPTLAMEPDFLIRSPIAGPPAEEHIQRANPKGGQEKKKGENASDGNGAAP